MYYVQAAPLVSFVLVAFRIAQRWWIELNVALGKHEKNEKGNDECQQ
jgi:TRAP-type C4-dicarboxylate transport system permease small subunit